MRFWVGVSAAFGAGTIIGIGLGTLLVEKKLKDEYEASSAAMRRAYEAARIDAETPSLTEEDLIVLKPKGDTIELVVDGQTEPIVVHEVPEIITDTVVQPTQSDNPYHDAVTQTATNGIYASFAVLEESDYYDEDGRTKEQLTMIFSDGEPVFFKDGAEIEVSDAMDMVGSTIVDDMRNAVREGTPVLFMRNNQTDTDYEVLFDQP
jgi:hypothetical protein